MAKIQITDLRLRTIIGANEWERDVKQDLIINITITFDASKACDSDDLKDTLDYKNITKKVIEKVEGSSYFLIEKLASQLLKIVLDNPLAQTATVRVDKPFALRFADSVSIELTSSNTHE